MVSFSLIIFTIHGLDVTFSIQKVTTVSSRFIHNPALCLHHNRWLTVKPNKKRHTEKKKKGDWLILIGTPFVGQPTEWPHYVTSYQQQTASYDHQEYGHYFTEHRHHHHHQEEEDDIGDEIQMANMAFINTSKVAVTSEPHPPDYEDCCSTPPDNHHP